MVEIDAGDMKSVVKTLTVGKMYMVPVDSLRIAPGFNVRVTDDPDYQAKLNDLKASIMQEGFYSTQPLAGFVGKDKDGGDVIFVTNGHRRLTAAKAAIADGADIEKLPVILKPATASGLDLTTSLYRENTGEPLTMMEKAIVVKRLLNSGMDEKEVASKLDMTQRYISDLLLLVNSSKPVRALVTAGKVAGTEAVKQLRRNPEAAAEKLQELASKAEQKGKTRATAGDALASEPTIKMKTVVSNYALKKGQTASYAEIEPFEKLMGEADWYQLTDRPGEIVALEDFEISIKVRRPKRDEPEAEQGEGEGEAEAQAEATPPKKRGKKPAMAEADDTPDLVSEGIADPAADL